MRTTRQITEQFFPSREGAFTAAFRAMVKKVTSVHMAITNRIAAQRIGELDDYLLNDLGLTRAEFNSGLARCGLLDDPSVELARTVRAKARTQMPVPKRQKPRLAYVNDRIQVERLEALSQG